MCSSRDYLLSVQVFMRDVVAGRKPFIAAWNGWCNRRALPALSVQESYLGEDQVLIAVAAVAAVPRT
jgi:hypothetical protein